MKELLRSEDWWAIWVGILVFGLSLAVPYGIDLVGQPVDLLGWAASTQEWLDVSQAVTPVSPAYKFLPGWAGLLLTFLFLLVVLSAGAWCLGFDLRRFVPAFSALFWISYVCLLLGHYAYIATTPDKQAKFHIGWSLGITGEAGYILALVAGLLIGNFLPGVSHWLRESARAEWFVKTAIVILGAVVSVKAAERFSQTTTIMFRGFAAIVEAYLIYWALVYLLARKVFKFSREWAAPLASGISICGVSAAIATGSAIRARPVVPIMVSSLVVIFAVIELLLLPVLARTFLSHEPMVAAAWMGLAVKTDGAAIASGSVTQALIGARAAEEGTPYDPQMMLLTTTTVKVFIDAFIGIWAFILALIWVYRIDPRPGERVRLREIWDRFPKFVLGYVFTFLTLFLLALRRPELLGGGGSPGPLQLATKESDVFRVLFFVMTFFAIGLAANFRKLWQEGIARLALVYVLSLFGFIIWIGLAISWLFFHGVHG